MNAVTRSTRFATKHSSQLIINLGAILHNFMQIKYLCPDALIMPVLKADAYGHGICEVARLLVDNGARYFGVAFLEEAIILREAGITTPILVLGGLSGSQIRGFLEYDIDFTASSIFKLEKIFTEAKAAGKTARVHIKIDTGMGRIGVQYDRFDLFLSEAVKYISKHLEIVGMFSHFAASEWQDKSYATLQLERFNIAVEKFSKLTGFTPLRHMANSGAILQLPESHLDIVRPGLLLYGVNPLQFNHSLNLQIKPSMTIRSEVVYFKVLEKDQPVSYDCTYITKERTRIVTVPIGYGDGFPRQLSNKGQVLINGQKLPIAGRVCMDQLMVDIGPKGKAYNSDEVILLGKQGNQQIKVEDIIALSAQDPREFLLNLKLRLPKVYVKSDN
jgi:alanine racemase